jgi:VanZ family protein
MGDDPHRLLRLPLPRWLVWAVWVVGFLAWTYLLVMPTYWLPPWFRFGAGKGPGGIGWGKLGHVAAYATLTTYPLWLLVGPRAWWAVAALLSLHAFGTEVIQSVVPTRGGSGIDVVINHVGLILGVLLGRLGHWGGGRFGPGGAGRERVAAAPQADRGASREDAQADPL